MRMLLSVRIPHKQFNAAVKDGTASDKIRRILEDTKPEAVYFTEHNSMGKPLVRPVRLEKL